MVKSTVAHFDETGMRVNGRLWWLHVACSHGLTYYFAHPKRGQAAMDEMAILPEFTGKAIHDGWKSYAGYDCEHFLCNAHHLRELQFILERYGQWWTYQLSLLLTTILGQVQAAKAQGQNALTPEQRLPDAPKKEAVPSARLRATFWSDYALNKTQCLVL
jgi:transposase